MFLLWFLSFVCVYIYTCIHTCKSIKVLCVCLFSVFIIIAVTAWNQCSVLCAVLFFFFFLILNCSTKLYCGVVFKHIFLPLHPPKYIFFDSFCGMDFTTNLKNKIKREQTTALFVYMYEYDSYETSAEKDLICWNYCVFCSGENLQNTECNRSPC